MDAIKIEDGEIVTKPGIYDVSIGWYHQQCCDGPSISSSGIRAILRSPAEFWKTSSLNPNRVEEDDKDAFILGRAAHHLLLGERQFGQHFVVSPFKDFRTKEAKEWKAAEIEAGRTVLTEAQIERIKGMAGLLPWQKGMPNCGLANTPIIAEGGALSGDIERSLIFKVGNVWVKARPDSIPNSNDIVDLKTISPRSADGISDRALSIAVFDHQYNVQGAVVGMGMKEVLDRQMESFNLAFVDTGNVHAVAIKAIDEADIVLGERATFTGIKIFERCLDSGIWPGPTARQADAQRLSIPTWGRESIERRLDTLEAEFA
jgi:hypothetical protein